MSDDSAFSLTILIGLSSATDTSFCSSCGSFEDAKVSVAEVWDAEELSKEFLSTWEGWPESCSVFLPYIGIKIIRYYTLSNDMNHNILSPFHRYATCLWKFSLVGNATLTQIILVLQAENSI